MGIAGQSITLANSIIGVGILAMPFCFQRCGILLASVILLSMGLVSRLCCHFLLKSALLARRRNFEFLAFHVFGPAGKLAVEVGIIGFLMGTCIAYFVVVGDLGPQIIAKLFNINQSDILRTSIMVIVSLVCVLPLGLLRNVDSLSNVSAATIGFYLCLVIKVITEAASQMLTKDMMAKIEMWNPDGLLQCVPIFSMALFCQTQLFEIFESLPTLSLEKMNTVTKNAINICTAVYFTLGLFGYIAFSSHDISGNILMSLAPTMANDVIKLGFVMSLAFSFPLVIFPCRASLYSFLYKKVHTAHHDHIINHSIPETTFRCITVAIIAGALFISLLIPNIELVLGLVGSTIGVLICVVFPAACFINVTFKNTNERVLAKGVLILGLVIMVLGTYANLQAAETKLDRYDDSKITQERIDKIVEDFFENMEKKHGHETIDKPLDENKAVSPEEIVKKEVVKDSEIQPPNPIPPESQSNEKHKVDIKSEEKIIKNAQNLIPIAENVGDKISESHPKNLKTKLKEARIANGKIIENIELEKKKEEKIDLTQIQDKTQQKIDMLKQQKLIETIKQHGEEQKELIKEQKELLNEIREIKTNKELQQNKKEIDDTEAKKIAVESIQKIANMAIKSLSGVTNKPSDKDIRKQPLEKIANEAVQEIAKKVVETIEAIKERNVPQIKEDKSGSNGASPLSQVNNLPPVLINAETAENARSNLQADMPNNKHYNTQDVNVQENPVKNNAQLQPNQNLMSVNVPVPNIPHAEALIQDKNVAEVLQNNNNAASLNLNNENAQPMLNQIVNNIPISPIESSEMKSNLDHIQPVQNQVLNDGIINQQQQNKKNVQNSENQMLHYHSPDEPQSYKQREDSQTREMVKNVAENVPVPIVMKGNSNPIVKEALTDNIMINNNVQSVNSVQNNGANSINNVDNPRQKREVVDCTETVTLEPQDREICKALLGPKFNKKSEEILPSNVDFNELVLPNHLPMDVHHMRSLKSFDENNKDKR